MSTAHVDSPCQKEYVAPARATRGGRIAVILPYVGPDAKLIAVDALRFCIGGLSSSLNVRKNR
jgi:hypothetical protein